MEMHRVKLCQPHHYVFPSTAMLWHSAYDVVEWKLCGHTDPESDNILGLLSVWLIAALLRFAWKNCDYHGGSRSHSKPVALLTMTPVGTAVL